MPRGNPNPSPSTRFSSVRQPENRRQPDPLLAMLRERMKDDDMERMIDVAISRAKAGDIRFFEMIWDRTAGKVVARQESGDPGAFTGLEDVPSEELIRRLDEYKRMIR